MEVVQTSMSNFFVVAKSRVHRSISDFVDFNSYIFEVFLLFIVKNLNLVLKIKLEIMFYSFILASNNLAVPIFIQFKILNIKQMNFKYYLDKVKIN